MQEVITAQQDYVNGLKELLSPFNLKNFKVLQASDEQSPYIIRFDLKLSGLDDLEVYLFKTTSDLELRFAGKTRIDIITDKGFKTGEQLVPINGRAVYPLSEKALENLKQGKGVNRYFTAEPLAKRKTLFDLANYVFCYTTGLFKEF